MCAHKSALLFTMGALVTSTVCGVIHPAIHRRQVNANTQTCLASDNLHGLDTTSYGVIIGVPFQNGEGCNDIQNTLSTAVGNTFNGFTCIDNGDGQTQLNFDTQFQIGIGAKINSALESIFPENLVHGGFNCPDF